MNYQHAFHAGNFADVHKHVVLARILEHLRQKPSAFRVIDTHAGAGRYDLFGPEAMRSEEWRGGIGRIFGAVHHQKVAPKDEAQALLSPYLDIIAELNPGGEVRIYPGSPLIALGLMRRQDRLIACELEPRAAGLLKTALKGDARAKVLAIDGWLALNANVPPKERRGVVVVDPPFEEGSDFTRLSATFAAAHRKWPTGTYLLWYPIKERDAPDAFLRRLHKLAIPKILRCEMMLGAPRADAGLVGSGLVVVNPPHILERDMRIILPALANLLLPDATHRLDWLVQERPNTAQNGQ
ncbi:MAG TPA: 23S rRNA (adenine(2030)-N(6))-methyltransferase RlmJ [Xanthobacteraceae bacterium]|jgi:23S rRNA (adenine2030-N6)-methyltransferase|nr:23S rRNA (adenine(2030)-N(6))-methyltransferase RlmJ [Xanthobacteraceae bacterium]